eukprot:6573065-Pyramimonas_sp.AAC.1
MGDITSLQRLALSQDAQGRELAAATLYFWLCPITPPAKAGKKSGGGLPEDGDGDRQGPWHGAASLTCFGGDVGGDEGPCERTIVRRDPVQMGADGERGEWPEPSRRD